MIIKIDEFEKNLIEGSLPNAAGIDIVERIDDILVRFLDENDTCIAWFSKDKN